jgi:hypothetical protein
MKPIKSRRLVVLRFLNGTYVKTRQKLTAIMDAVFEMHLDLEVLSDLHALKDAAKSTQRAREL